MTFITSEAKVLLAYLKERERKREQITALGDETLNCNRIIKRDKHLTMKQVIDTEMT